MYKQKLAEYEVGSLLFKVKIIGEKSTYGRKRYLITPKDGQGSAWVGVGITLITTPK